MKREELECPVVDEYYGEGEYERFKDKYYYKDEADKVMDALQKRIKELELQLPKWISVKDRLPTVKDIDREYDETDVWVCLKNYEVQSIQWDWVDKERHLYWASQKTIVPQPPLATEDFPAIEKEKGE